MIRRAWPNHIDYLLAKSADKSAGDAPETLAEHTYSVLEKLASLIHLRPTLPEQIGIPRLWHILFWATFLHDFGKAAKGFQARLKSKDAPRWAHRHEVLSLAFVDWILSAFEKEEQYWLIAAIVSHHRDVTEIARLYNLIDRAESAFSDEIDAKVIDDLWKWIAEYSSSWIDMLELNDYGIAIPTLPTQSDAVSSLEQNIPATVRKWLNLYHRWFDKEVSRSKQIGLTVGTILLRGHLISSDHMASAHVGELPEPQLSNPDELIAKLKLDNLYEHQRLSMNARGSTVLMSPTGSGKTEAALLWAVSQQPPRLYYSLPFQASMNAMEKRLNEDEENEAKEIIREAPFKNQVGLEHSRSLLAYYRRLLYDNENADPKQATKDAKWLKNLAKLNYYPVRVLSPYQLLKAPYRLKGYETLLTDCYGAAFVFDEIHAYEAARLAKIFALIKYLRENYNAKFFVMSATLPKLLRESLQDALGDYTSVTASDDLYREFRRHRLSLHDGELLSEKNLDYIAETAKKGQTVLVCCNTIPRAQTVWKELSRRLEGKVDVELLHGKFNGRDRLKKEQMVRDATGSRSTTRINSIVLVATQVVEVSLDIDLDIIFTDPAPLEALLQRFGRINRRRKKGIVSVCVFREPIPEKPRPYNPELIRAALDVLEKQNGNEIDEAQVSAWLDEIYERPEISEPWLETYRREYREFTETALMNLHAFESDDALEDLFYEAFDSVDVLPEDLYNEYLNARGQSPIEASQLLVPLDYRMFGRLKSEGRGYTDEEGKLKLVKVYYDSEVGLDLNHQMSKLSDDW